MNLHRIHWASVFAVCLLIAAVAAHSDQSFPDVPKNHWAYQAVTELHQKEILIGYPNGTFNGVIPKGQPKPKPAYDLSTPQNTWNSLMRAMTGGDEEEMGRILTLKCWLNDLQNELGINLKMASVHERATAYCTLSARLSKWRFVVEHRPLDKADNEILADLDDGHLDEFIGHGWSIQMNKTGDLWKVTAIIHNTE